MHSRRRSARAVLGLAAAVLVLAASAVAFAQGKHQTFGATAVGEGSYLGKTFNVTIILESYSTAEDQQVLLDAFAQAGNQGVVNALAKMGSKGHIAITGTPGYDIKYAREFSLPDGGRRIRLVTDRPITFGEMWSDSRATGYTLSALELELRPGQDESRGTLVPACQFSISKEKELTIEAYADPWKLTDVVVW
ncbi:MAG TPA: hypothetical protein VEG08_12025 [Terriglobales bacterium]|nr:hypothetical protein [Terriglobales bacterium]